VYVDHERRLLLLIHIFKDKGRALDNTVQQCASVILRSTILLRCANCTILHFTLLRS
jgi:hypothetical protein